jgi:hypothetical protein
MALKSVYGMNKGDDSRTRPGEKDYTGHKGDKSKSRPGDEDYEAHKGSHSKTRPGEEDFTGHKGDKSKTRPGHEDYEAHKGTKSKTHAGKDYEGEHKTKEGLADHLALEARDGAHLLELLEDSGWTLTPPGGEDIEVEGEETLALGAPLGMPMGGPPKLDIVSARFRAAENAMKGKGKGRG